MLTQRAAPTPTEPATSAIPDAIYANLQEKLREAVKVLIEFSKCVLKEFSIRHRDTIVEYLADNLDVRNAAQSINVFARPFLDDRQLTKEARS